MHIAHIVNVVYSVYITYSAYLAYIVYRCVVYSARDAHANCIVRIVYFVDVLGPVVSAYYVDRAYYCLYFG